MAEELSPDICVIGGGPAGVALAAGAANNGVPVVLIEKGEMGGANLARGAIPSKALVAVASYYETLRRGPAVGVTGAPLQVNFGRVHDHIRSVTESAARNVSRERLAALGVTVIAAEGRFVDPRTVVAGETTVRARRFVIATGSLPRFPDIPGLAEIEYLTAETAFDGIRKPSHLLVLGADSRGLELAQAYNRLGVDTTVIDSAKALAGSDPELVAPLLDRLRAEGIRIRDAARIVEFSRRRGGVRATLADPAEGELVIDASHLLVIGDRAPNIGGLGLEAAGIAYTDEGITVDRSLRTSNRRVHAIGDVVAGAALANRAQHQAASVLRALLYRLPFRDRSREVAAITFTDPALATVGLGEREARQRYKDARVLRFPFADNDLSQAERTTAGLVKVITTGRGRILGVGIVGHDAGEQIALWALALERRLPVEAVAATALPYPSRAEASRRAAASFDGPGLTPIWRRRIIEFLRKLG